MKAVRVHELGGADVLRYEEVPEPKPKAGEVLVRIAASGVNYLDIYYRSGFHWGGHHGRPLPYIPGAEAAGTVTEIGPDVTDVRTGDRVAYAISNGYGAYAEFYAVPAWHLYKIPSSIAFEPAAAIMLQGMTAHYLTHSTYAVRPNDTVLVHAAAGGTGLLLIQLAKMRGARVFGTVSTLEKARLAQAAGADATINYTEQDFAAEVRKLTNGTGVNVVYDSVGKATFEKSLDCLAALGMLVIFGQASGPVPPFDTAVLNAKGSLTLARPSLTHHVANHADVLRRAGDLFNWLADGKLSVTVGNTYRLRHAADAHRELESRKSVGKILLIP
ncbi:MAG: zinc-binding dehydrogenase [Deltaproteobacteria bacterium]|nr:zinc-binding dehydrogenase [Deltaproteobacteria bacterium]